MEGRGAKNTSLYFCMLKFADTVTVRTATADSVTLLTAARMDCMENLVHCP